MTTIAGDACKIASRSLICGRFSRWVLAPATAVDADTTARLFYERWVGTFGPPAFLVSDGGSAFISRTFQQLSDLLASQHHITSPHHPESHGTVERANRSVLATLRTLLHETVTRPRSWVDAIPAIQFALNTSCNRVTGVTPWEVLHGFPPRLPFFSDLGILHLSDDPESLAARLAARSVGLIAQVAAAEKESFAKVRAAYEKKHRQHPEYSPGDYALCRNFQAGKLEMPWNGPFLVTAVNDNSTLTLINILDNHEFKAHVNNLAPFVVPADRLAPTPTNPATPPEPTLPTPATTIATSTTIATATATAPADPITTTPAATRPPTSRATTTAKQPLHPLATAALKEGEYLVEEVFGHDLRDGHLWFRVKWVDYPAGVDEWVAYRDCRWAPAVKAYIKANTLHPTLRPLNAAAAEGTPVNSRL
ncbi:putative Retrovirus-related Pol polyprotein [Paratrimastix pyriformis]|uniref:Retrovirus-related Pol polyprotein n=1 Tax=Paratrimastix pyriformis TaxID=342808 RepID=A0ABQ8U547_9EUKA|nr:putative Retrovirus-related Pol polyprotein [Paratrimastix pyriformis]